MKAHVLNLGTFLGMIIVLVSCKDKRQQLVENRIDKIEHFVDSLKTLDVEEMAQNWEAIDGTFQNQSEEIDSLTDELPDEKKEVYKYRLNTVTTKYFDIRTVVVKDTVVIEKPVLAGSLDYQKLRDQLFGAGVLGKDMNFNWVNKSNILSVYQKFFDSFKINKDKYTREDFDEIKLMYEALDTRKNTVEKEGLSSEDNSKIAAIKFRFAPMFKLNRIVAKSEENQEAKE